MSTSTTAAAAAPLPRYGHRHYAYPHHHHHHNHHHHLSSQLNHHSTQSSSSGASTYRNQAAAAGLALLSPYSSSATIQQFNEYVVTSNHHQQLDEYAVASNHQQQPTIMSRPLSSGSGPGNDDISHAPDAAPPLSQSGLSVSSSTMSASSSAQDTVPTPTTTMGAADAIASPLPRRQGAPPPVKRRRSQGPNWAEFYKNGLPSEVIVIEDTPECEAVTTTKVAAASTVVAIDDQSAVTTTSPVTANSAKKRKREVETYDIAALKQQQQQQQQQQQHATASADDLQLSQRRKRLRRAVADGISDELEGTFQMPYRKPDLPIKKVDDVAVRVIRETRAQKNVKIDDDHGHYLAIPETELTSKYKIVKVLGQGTFGKVVQATERDGNKAVAIKIIRAVQKYRDAARIELRVLETLKLNDAENRNRCIHSRDCFDFRGHICIVTDLLGQSVFDFLRGTQFAPFPNSHIQSFARQLLTSVAYLHDIKLVHTDLKPENILLCDDSYQTFTYSRRVPSSSHNINRSVAQRRVLLNSEIRLIDFGSATFQDEHHSSVVSTRHYRAPEIILGLGWSYPCDIWSIGCILVEFFTGDALFQTHDNLEHLAMMQAVVGSKIDGHLVSAVNRLASSSTVHPAAQLFKKGNLDYPARFTTRFSKKCVKAMKTLEETIPCTTSFQSLFVDLLRKMFVYDPAKRITAHQALQHPWFREVPIPDDGTEALRIRQHRSRMAAKTYLIE